MIHYHRKKELLLNEKKNIFKKNAYFCEKGVVFNGVTCAQDSRYLVQACQHELSAKMFDARIALSIPY